jgi:hypothetical protein
MGVYHLFFAVLLVGTSILVLQDIPGARGLHHFLNSYVLLATCIGAPILAWQYPASPASRARA